MRELPADLKLFMPVSSANSSPFAGRFYEFCASCNPCLAYQTCLIWDKSLHEAQNSVKPSRTRRAIGWVNRHEYNFAQPIALVCDRLKYDANKTSLETSRVSFRVFPWVRFLQRRLSLGELLGVWSGCPLKAVETGDIICNKKSESWSFFTTITIMRSFSCVVKLFPTIFLNSRVSNWKIISIRDGFNSNNFILTALNVLVRRLSFKTQCKIEFWGPFHGLKISQKKHLNVGLGSERSLGFVYETTKYSIYFKFLL